MTKKETGNKANIVTEKNFFDLDKLSPEKLYELSEFTKFFKTYACNFCGEQTEGMGVDIDLYKLKRKLSCEPAKTVKVCYTCFKRNQFLLNFFTNQCFYSHESEGYDYIYAKKAFENFKNSLRLEE